MKQQPYAPDPSKRLALDRIAKLLPDTAFRSCPQITTVLRRHCRRLNLPMVDVPEVAQAIVAAVDRGELEHRRCGMCNGAWQWSEFARADQPLFVR